MDIINEETDGFYNYLIETIPDFRACRILDALNELDDYLKTYEGKDGSLYRISDPEEVEQILEEVKNRPELRGQFRGKCNLLVSGLMNLSNYIVEAQNGQVEDQAALDERKKEFARWFYKRGADETTLKGYAIAFRDANLFVREQKIADSDLLRIDEARKIASIIDHMKVHPVFLLHYQEKMIQVLYEYAVFLEQRTRNVRLEQVASALKAVLAKYPDLGLYADQIHDLTQIVPAQIEEVLNSASWCIERNNRFYYLEPKK